jgi:hypothetical protein
MWSQLSVTEEPDNARRPEISLDMGLFELYVLGHSPLDHVLHVS